MNQTKKIVAEYRNKVIEGRCINLVPLSMSEAQNIVKLRNKEINKHFLTQGEDLTEEKQSAFIESYLKKDDDIYWCIYNKEGKFVGTTRLYDINGEIGLCDMGSFIVDKDILPHLPYAKEAEIMVFDFAFNTLKMKQVINEIRVDNDVMNHIALNLGFKYQKETMLYGARHNYYLLYPADYEVNREKFVEEVKERLEKFGGGTDYDTKN